MAIKLSASVSCANPLYYPDSIHQLDEAGLDTYHFDMCDGHFAPTFLLWPGLMRHLRPLTSRRFDVHLYCSHPSRYLDELAACGADLIAVHVEADENYVQVVREISRRGLKAGVAILPGSHVPPNIIEVLPDVTMVIGNTVGPAYAGQPFDRRGLKNLIQLSRLLAENGLTAEVAADGSVSLEHLEELIGAGCTHLVCGTSSIFRPGANVGEALRLFHQQVNTHSSYRRLEDAN